MNERGLTWFLPTSGFGADQSIPEKLPRLSGTFDLYVDGIRFLPETILLARITGGLLNPLMDLGGEKTDFKEVEISAYPSLNSKARSPSFHCKVRINEEKAMLNPHALLHLEIVGFESHSGQTVRVGSAVLPLFQKTKGSPVNVGGHQVQVRRGQLGPEDSDGKEYVASRFLYASSKAWTPTEFNYS